MPPIEKKARTSVSVSMKLKILEEAAKKRLSNTELAKKFGIPRTTLVTIIKNEKKICEMKNFDPNRSRAREAKHPKLEQALIEWLKIVRSKNIPIDGQVLKTKAESFALQMKITGFNISEGWLQRFKNRHGLRFRKLCGESAAANPDTAKEWRESRIKDILANYKPEDVFNADETGLFYKLLPEKTLVFKGDACSGGKRAKDRITLLLAANMTGTEKLPLLVVGKSKKPRCFKGMKSIPVKYTANANAWMKEDIFSEWVKNLDRKMKAQGRKILLIIDNCTAHCNVDDLEAVTIEFLPPNLTSLLQPLDQGVIESFKKHYRRMLLNRIVLCLDSGKTYEIDLLKGIFLAISAWQEVTEKTIANCFRHAGFVSSASETVSAAETTNQEQEEELAVEGGSGNGEDQLMLDYQKHVPNLDICFQNYVDIDENVNCFQTEYSDSEIVNRVSQEVLAESSEEEDEVTHPRAKPTSKEALDALDLVRRFFEEEMDSAVHISKIMDLENGVVRCARFKQRSIDEYLHPLP